MKPVDAGSAARQYASKGFDVIIGHGAQYKNLITEMAEEFPKVSFAFGTSADVGAKNVFTYMPQSEETGYLNGLIAGMVTKSERGRPGRPGRRRRRRPLQPRLLARREGRQPEGRHQGGPHRLLRRLRQGRRAGPDPDPGRRRRADRLGPAGPRRPPRGGQLQGQDPLVGRPGRGPARHPGEHQGHRRGQLRLRRRHPGAHRQARGRDPGRREPARSTSPTAASSTSTTTPSARS